MSDVDEAETPEAREDVRDEVREENIRSVRIGHGANCSSVGSVIDTLFLGAAVGGAIFAAVCAAMKVESVTVVGGNTPARGAGAEPDAPDSSDTKASDERSAP